MKIPSKQQILEKYRNVIDAEDFEILYRDSFPTPQEVHQENATLQYVGQMNGFSVWAKRIFYGAISAVIFVAELDDGIQTVNKYARVGYEQLAHYVDLGSQNCESPADEFMVSHPPKHWPHLPNESIYLATTTTTTTTTTPPPESPPLELPPGSGLAPNSSLWT